jgi:predicted RNase H-like HicB family nuclease
MQPSLPDLPIWVYFERDPELGGTWVAHVLDLDLVTQGETLSEAIDMALDAAITVLADLVKHPGRIAEAYTAHRAPQEDWDKLWTLFERAPAKPLKIIVQSETEFSAMGTQLQVSAAAVFHRAFGADGDSDPEPVHAMPLGAVKKCA